MAEYQSNIETAKGILLTIFGAVCYGRIQKIE